jgi:hypothetical protein
MVPSCAGEAGSAGVAGPLPAQSEKFRASTRHAAAENILRIVIYHLKEFLKFNEDVVERKIRSDSKRTIIS